MVKGSFDILPVSYFILLVTNYWLFAVMRRWAMQMTAVCAFVNPVLDVHPQGQVSYECVVMSPLTCTELICFRTACSLLQSVLCSSQKRAHYLSELIMCNLDFKMPICFAILVFLCVSLWILIHVSKCTMIKHAAHVSSKMHSNLLTFPVWIQIDLMMCHIMKNFLQSELGF